MGVVGMILPKLCILLAIHAMALPTENDIVPEAESHAFSTDEIAFMQGAAAKAATSGGGVYRDALKDVVNTVEASGVKFKIKFFIAVTPDAPQPTCADTGSWQHEFVCETTSAGGPVLARSRSVGTS